MCPDHSEDGLPLLSLHFLNNQGKVLVIRVVHRFTVPEGVDPALIHCLVQVLHHE